MSDGDCDVSLAEIDRDFALLDDLCARSDLADDEQLDRALDEARREAKEYVYRQMEFPAPSISAAE